MEKYSTLCFGIFIQAFIGGEANAMGLGPLPYGGQNYQTNPTAKMTKSQKLAMKQSFAWAQNIFQKNHSLCRSRGECLNLDLRSLATYIHHYPAQPATGLFREIYNIIRHDSQHQKFVSEWTIFQYLSPVRQKEYRQGLRITPIQPQYVRTPRGTLDLALFNQDDVLTDVLQEVDHHHRNCEQYISCVRGDLLIIDKFYKRLAPTDPVRITLSNLSHSILTQSNQIIFNSSLYLNLYNPLSSDWYDTMRKHKAKKLAAYGYKEWRQIEKVARAITWRTPRILNKANMTPYQPYIPPKPPTVREWWRDKRNMIKSWW